MKRASTTAQLTSTSLSNGSETFLLGDAGSAGVNVNASSWSLSGILGVNVGTGFTPGPDATRAAAAAPGPVPPTC
jgi:hypothetical protein